MYKKHKTPNISYSLVENNIKVRVTPEFLDGKSEVFIWIYHVEIDNQSSNSIRLLNRYLNVFDDNGKLQKISGQGIIGDEIIISSGQSFKYSGGACLETNSGIVNGYYNAIDSENKNLKIKIPAFSLDNPLVSKNILN